MLRPLLRECLAQENRVLHCAETPFAQCADCPFAPFSDDESLFNLYTIPTMKNYLFHFCFLAFALLSLCGCDNLKYAELYEITDEFVEELHTDVESYGLLGGVDDTEYTDDGAFRVLPMGRLVNVKIENDATDEEYEALRAALESHYADDERVTEVYRCRAGTIMIDCRH